MSSFFERYGLNNQFKSSSVRCPKGSHVVDKNRPRGTNPTCVFEVAPPVRQGRATRNNRTRARPRQQEDDPYYDPYYDFYYRRRRNDYDDNRHFAHDDESSDDEEYYDRRRAQNRSCKRQSRKRALTCKKPKSRKSQKSKKSKPVRRGYRKRDTPFYNDCDQLDGQIRLLDSLTRRWNRGQLQSREEDLLRTFLNRLPLQNIPMAQRLNMLQSIISKYQSAAESGGDGQFSDSDKRLLREISSLPFLANKNNNNNNGFFAVSNAPVLNAPQGNGVAQSPQVPLQQQQQQQQQQAQQPVVAMPLIVPPAVSSVVAQPVIQPSVSQDQFGNIDYASLGSYNVVANPGNALANLAFPKNNQGFDPEAAYYLVYFTVAPEGPQAQQRFRFIVPLADIDLVAPFLESNKNALLQSRSPFIDYGFFNDEYTQYPVRVLGKWLTDQQQLLLNNAIRFPESVADLVRQNLMPQPITPFNGPQVGASTLTP